MPCHLEPQQLPTAMTQDKDRKQSFKPYCWNHAHIDGSNRIGVIQKKSPPRLRWRTQASGAPRGFEVRPWVFPAHSLDQITQITIDVRPPCPLPRFPAPESPEPSPMPPQNRFWLYHLSQIEQPGTHSSNPDQQGPIRNRGRGSAQFSEGTSRRKHSSAIIVRCSPQSTRIEFSVHTGRDQQMTLSDGAFGGKADITVALRN